MLDFSDVGSTPTTSTIFAVTCCILKLFAVITAPVSMVIRLGDPFTGAFMIHLDSYPSLSRHNQTLMSD